MGESLESDGQRLDSWKAIAAYLDRDVRTVRRWEKSLGLPVRRVPGSRGHSVFAYASEIEAWLQKSPPTNGVSLAERLEPADGSRSPQAEPIEHAARFARGLPSQRWAIVATGAVVALLTWGAWPGSTRDDLSIEVTPTAVIARTTSGVARWRHALPRGERAVPQALSVAGVVLDRPDPGALVGIGYRQRDGGNVFLDGQLLWFSPDGLLRRTFSFDDRLTFGAGTFTSPWLVTDFRVDERVRRRVAVAAHHYHWWPGVLAVLDGQGRREGTFVNAGWIEWIHWQSPDRLLIAGFSNARDGGMVALLDANAPDRQSPPTDDASFRCTSCGAGGPLRYVVLPRSEVNVATVSPFNRALLGKAGDRVVVRTIEVPSAGPAGVDAIYEFSPQLDLLGASYSDRYWETHRALEAHGKLNHSRAQCPERDGPRSIDVWTPQTGWKFVRKPAY